MRYFFDTEFIEDGKTIELISIGIVSEDGRMYYAESSEIDLTKASPWVRENVLPHLNKIQKQRSIISREIMDFVGKKPEFWAYYSSYDWVCLCQLYGTMMQLPESWPKFCNDIKQLAGNRALPEQTSTEHNALTDALWNKECYNFLMK